MHWNHTIHLDLSIALTVRVSCDKVYHTKRVKRLKSTIAVRFSASFSLYLLVAQSLAVCRQYENGKPWTSILRISTKKKDSHHSFKRVMWLVNLWSVLQHIQRLHSSTQYAANTFACLNRFYMKLHTHTHIGRQTHFSVSTKKCGEFETVLLKATRKKMQCRSNTPKGKNRQAPITTTISKKKTSTVVGAQIWRGNKKSNGLSSTNLRHTFEIGSMVLP